jgi:DNA-directed RNA polymerase specialized sigma24 family protein
MRHYSGLSFKEISGLLGVPIGTVLARMSRAMAKMRETLQ